jgi:hypothetical protein
VAPTRPVAAISISWLIQKKHKRGKHGATEQDRPIS